MAALIELEHEREGRRLPGLPEDRPFKLQQEVSPTSLDPDRPLLSLSLSMKCRKSLLFGIIDFYQSRKTTSLEDIPN